MTKICYLISSLILIIIFFFLSISLWKIVPNPSIVPFSKIFFLSIPHLFIIISSVYLLCFIFLYKYSEALRSRKLNHLINIIVYASSGVYLANLEFIPNTNPLNYIIFLLSCYYLFVMLVSLSDSLMIAKIKTNKIEQEIESGLKELKTNVPVKDLLLCQFINQIILMILCSFLWFCSLLLCLAAITSN